MDREKKKKGEKTKGRTNPSPIGAQKNPVSNPDIPQQGMVDPAIFEEMKEIQNREKKKDHNKKKKE